MSKKAKKASDPIENEESIDISDAQKEHYRQLGYKPYLSHNGKIKWLSFDQHTFEKVKYANRNKTISIEKIQNKRRKTTKQFRNLLKMIKHNWFLLLLLCGFVVFIFYFEPIIAFITNLFY